MSGEFYIGYLDKGPPSLALSTRRRVLFLATLVVGLTALIAALQTPVEPGVFEYGVVRSFEGVLRERPLPILRSVSRDGSVTHYLLVGAGKHGLPAFARGHDGQQVRFRGSLIQKDVNVMIELNDAASFTVLGPGTVSENGPAEAGSSDLTLTGELVDTKCYLGVMRPATGKVHRACAARCLSGGVPPGLLLRDHEGAAVVLLMTGPGGSTPKVDPQWAARLIRAQGRLVWNEETPHLEIVSLALAD